MKFRTNTELVAEIRKELKALFPSPSYKLNVRKDHYYGVEIEVLKAPINLITDATATYERVNEYYIDQHYQNRPKAAEVLQTIIDTVHRVAEITYRETGDYGTQPSYYISLSVGSYSSPFQTTQA